jgi:hypothetical protein
MVMRSEESFRRHRKGEFAESGPAGTRKLPQPPASRAGDRYLGVLEAGLNKQPQRDWVTRFLLDNHSEVSSQFVEGLPAAVQLFSLPGSSWEFENRFRAQTGQVPVYHSAVEWSYRTLAAGLPHMPGTRRVELTLRTDAGDIWGYESQEAAVLWIEARSFFLLEVKNIAPPRLRGWFKDCFRSCSAAWLDFTSCLSPDTITTCHLLPKVMARTYGQIPVCISFMLGRELPDVMLRVKASTGKTPVEKRVSLVNSLLSGKEFWDWEFKDHLVHRSRRACMITVAGLLVPKNPEAVKNTDFRSACGYSGMRTFGVRRRSNGDGEATSRTPRESGAWSLT